MSNSTWCGKKGVVVFLEGKKRDEMPCRRRSKVPGEVPLSFKFLGFENVLCLCPTPFFSLRVWRERESYVVPCPSQRCLPPARRGPMQACWWRFYFPFVFLFPPNSVSLSLPGRGGGGEMLISACCLHMFFLALSLSHLACMKTPKTGPLAICVCLSRRLMDGGMQIRKFLLVVFVQSGLGSRPCGAFAGVPRARRVPAQ